MPALPLIFGGVLGILTAVMLILNIAIRRRRPRSILVPLLNLGAGALVLFQVAFLAAHLIGAVTA